MIRKGTIEDAEILSKVEATCFPPNEAATSKEIQERLNDLRAVIDGSSFKRIETKSLMLAYK